MKQQLGHVLLVSVLPALAVSVLFYVLLGHRRDYLGHYAAGYGGTLCATTIVLAAVPLTKFHMLARATVLPATLLCIAAGTVAEATVFRLAKFDEIDFCNQNLGAVLAGLAAMFLAGAAKPSDAALRLAITVGAIFLLAGAYFALRKALPLIVLLLLGLLFAGGNLWFAAARSTIPLRLHGKVARKDRLIEKTPGVDDAFLLTFADETTIQVDGPVYEAMVLNQPVRKDRWSPTLEIADTITRLDWSQDFYGMIWAMPLVMVLFILLAILTIVHHPDDD